MNVIQAAKFSSKLISIICLIGFDAFFDFMVLQ